MTVAHQISHSAPRPPFPVPRAVTHRLMGLRIKWPCAIHHDGDGSIICDKTLDPGRISAPVPIICIRTRLPRIPVSRIRTAAARRDSSAPTEDRYCTVQYSALIPGTEGGLVPRLLHRYTFANIRTPVSMAVSIPHTRRLIQSTRIAHVALRIQQKPRNPPLVHSLKLLCGAQPGARLEKLSLRLNLNFFF